MGERSTPNPSPVSPKGRSQDILEQNIDLENQQNHQPTSPLPIWEGRGDRSTQHPEQSPQSGKGPSSPPLFPPKFRFIHQAALSILQRLFLETLIHAPHAGNFSPCFTIRVR